MVCWSSFRFCVAERTGGGDRGRETAGGVGGLRAADVILSPRPSFYMIY